MKPLRIAILPSGPFTVNMTSDGEVVVTGGFEAVLLDMLQRGLRQPFALLVPDDGTWGASGPDGNWTGLMGMLQRDEADMALSSIFVSEARMSVVTFTYPYSWQDITFATRMPRLRHTGTAFAWPFAWLVWLSLGICLVGFTTALRFCLSKAPPVDTIALHVLGVLLHQANGIRGVVARDRCLLMLWMLGCFFLSNGYTAVLLSFLSVPELEPPLETVSQLADAVVAGRYQCATAAGSSVIESLLQSRDQSVRTIGSYIWKKDWFVNVQTDDAVKKYLEAGNTAIIATRERMKFQFQQQFYLSKDALYSSPLAIALNKKSTLKTKMDVLVKKINGAGIYQKNMRDYLFLKNLPSDTPNTDSIKQLSLSDMYGAFILLGSGLLIASLVFIGESMYARSLIRNRVSNLIKMNNPESHANPSTT